MTREEAINILENGNWWAALDDWCHENREEFDRLYDATALAISALRDKVEAEKIEPLTLDELREMDGEPVWLVSTPDADGECLAMWALVSVDEEDNKVFLLNSIGGSSAYEEVWSEIRAIYRRKPEEGAL